MCSVMTLLAMQHNSDLKPTVQCSAVMCSDVQLIKCSAVPHRSPLPPLLCGYLLPMSYDGAPSKAAGRAVLAVRLSQPSSCRHLVCLSTVLGS